jgi:sortase (surface protein transpeptidase)
MKRRHREPRDGGRYSGASAAVRPTSRRHEVTLYDSAPGWTSLARRTRRERRSFAAAALVPALIGAIGGALLAPGFGADDGARLGPDSAAASSLASEAARPLEQSDLPRLVPIADQGTESSRPAAPFWISIPDAGVESPVDALGRTRKGLAVPDLGRAGWWNGGPRPGEVGRSVIVGHLDARDGPDVFARVPKLDQGDAIVVRDQAGRSHSYAVVGVTRVRKARFPTDDVYGPSPRPVLVLVTCGGPYDSARGHYRDNVLVYARAL